MNHARGPRPDPHQVDPEITQVVGALRGPATPEELREQERYLQVFDDVGPAPGRVVELAEADRGTPLRTLRIGSKVAAAVAAILVVAVSAAAAYTGSLPRGLQSSAHRLLGVQAPPSTTTSTGISTGTPTSGAGATSATAGPSGTPGSSLSPTTGVTGSTGTTGTPTGPSGSPSLSTPAGIAGLCTAWAKGGLATTSTSYRRLATAAGGSADIGSYCAGVLASPPTGSSTTTHGRSSDPTKNAHRAAKAAKSKGPKHPKADKRDGTAGRAL